MLFTVTSTNGFYPPLSKSGLNLVGKVSIVYRNLKSKKPRNLTKLYVHEFGFWYQVNSQIHTKKEFQFHSVLLQRKIWMVIAKALLPGNAARPLYCRALEPRALLPGTTCQATSAETLVQGNSCQGLLPGHYCRGTRARELMPGK